MPGTMFIPATASGPARWPLTYRVTKSTSTVATERDRNVERSGVRVDGAFSRRCVVSTDYLVGDGGTLCSIGLVSMRGNGLTSMYHSLPLAARRKKRSVDRDWRARWRGLGMHIVKRELVRWGSSSPRHEWWLHVRTALTTSGAVRGRARKKAGQF